MKRELTYKQQLIQREKTTQSKIDDLDNQMTSREMDAKWFELNAQRNGLKITLKAIKDRLKHLNNYPPTGIKPIKIDFNNINQ